MTQKQIKIARRILAPYVERTETAICDGGQCLTAFFTDGYQRIFHNFDHVTYWHEAYHPEDSGPFGSDDGWGESGGITRPEDPGLQLGPWSCGPTH